MSTPVVIQGDGSPVVIQQSTTPVVMVRDDGNPVVVVQAESTVVIAVAMQGPPGTWDDLTGKPSTFPPSTHSHVVSDVMGLQTALDAKQATLVNQANIKSINGVSLLGAGNMTISGGGGGSSAWADITDKPTTLTGYGITDAEPSITKSIGYAKWTGSAWSFANENYMQTSHDANAVTAAAISNWNTAFGWGDHATAGYTSNLGTVTAVAALTLGTSGTDVGSSVATGTTTPVITLNIPTASAANRGALSSADWSTFNGKQAALGFTAENVSNKSTNATTDASSNTKYPSVKAIVDYAVSADASVLSSSATDATTKANAAQAAAIAASTPVSHLGSGGAAHANVVAAGAAGFMSGADKTKLDAITGANSGDETGARIATLHHAASAKSALGDADEITGGDSATSFGLIRTTWTDVKTFLAMWIAGGTIAGSFTTLAASGNVTLGDASTDTLNIGNGGIYKDASGRTGVNTIAPRSILHVELPNTANAFALVRTSTGITGGGGGGTAFTATDTIPIISGTGFAGYGGLAIIPNRWGNATTADYHTALYMAGGQRNNGASVTTIAFANWGYFTGTGIAAGGLGEDTARNDAVSFSIAHLDGGSQFVQTLRIKGRTATGVTSNLLSINTTGTVLAHGAGGLGYGTGAGGTVTQATSRTTGVTLSKPTGKITLFSTTATTGTFASFTLTNTLIAATDVVIVNFASATSADKYSLFVTAVAAGSCRIQVYNIAAVAVAEAPVINFAVIKGATS